MCRELGASAMSGIVGFSSVTAAGNTAGVMGTAAAERTGLLALWLLLPSSLWLQVPLWQ